LSAQNDAAGETKGRAECPLSPSMAIGRRTEDRGHTGVIQNNKLQFSKDIEPMNFVQLFTFLFAAPTFESEDLEGLRMQQTGSMSSWCSARSAPGGTTPPDVWLSADQGM
jgi:hypothetical protein